MSVTETRRQTILKWIGFVAFFYLVVCPVFVVTFPFEMVYVMLVDENYWPIAFRIMDSGLVDRLV